MSGFFLFVMYATAIYATLQVLWYFQRNDEAARQRALYAFIVACVAWPLSTL